jgi:hypothetical protein
MGFILRSSYSVRAALNRPSLDLLNRNLGLPIGRHNALSLTSYKLPLIYNRASADSYKRSNTKKIGKSRKKRNT